MKSIISKTESWAPPQMSLDQMLAASESEEDAMAAAAVFMGEKLGAGVSRSTNDLEPAVKGGQLAGGQRWGWRPCDVTWRGDGGVI